MSMSKRFVLCGMILLGLLLSLGWTQNPATKEGSPFKGRALHVSLKVHAGTADLFLEQPEVRAIGGQDFVVGRAVGAPNKVWVPLSQLNLIEEFADIAEMEKFYRVRPAQTEKKPLQ